MLRKWLNRRRGAAAVEDATDDRYSALEYLARSHSFVEVNFHRTGRSYQSMILALRAELGEIVLDELFPDEGTLELQRGDLAEVVQRGNGPDGEEQPPLRFMTRLLGREELHGAPAYRMELPANIDGSGPRRAYRVYVENETDLALEMAFENASPLLCRIVNLSIEGLKIDIEGDHSKELRHQRLLRGCRLQLPDGSDIECDLDVRNVACLQKPAPHTLVGAALKIPSAPQRVRLNRYLASIQRKQRRREMRF